MQKAMTLLAWRLFARAASLLCLFLAQGGAAYNQCADDGCNEQTSLLALTRRKKGVSSAQEVSSAEEIFTELEPIYNPDGSENKFLSHARAAYGQLMKNRSLTMLQTVRASPLPGSILQAPKDANTWKHVTGTASSVTDTSYNPIAKPGSLDFILGDPSVVLIDDTIHMWSNTIFGGIQHFTAPKERPWDMTNVGTSIHYPGAIRPYAYFDKDTRKIILYYEQMHLIANYWTQNLQFPYDSGTTQWVEADVDGKWAFWFGWATLALEPRQRTWEVNSQSRLGNPYVYFDKNTSKWRLYYSAGRIWLDDSAISEPRYLGVAESDHVRGPWTRLNDGKPITIDGNDCQNSGELCNYTMPGTDLIVIGYGSCKLIDVDNTGQNDFGLGICNRITSDPKRKTQYPDKYTGSTISLVKQDGLGWVTTLAELIGPSFIQGGWKESYTYGYDTLPDPTDPEYLLVYYNGRDGWKDKGEEIGVSRLPVSAIPGYKEACGATCVRQR